MDRIIFDLFYGHVDKKEMNIKNNQKQTSEKIQLKSRWKHFRVVQYGLQKSEPAAVFT